jgi:hypothetical protein
MITKEELVRRSPIRIFEQSIHGGLKPGEIGIVASGSGVGKTSVLVQLALDKLLQGKKVIHVSFTQHAHYIFSWYEDIFNEFISRKNLENAPEVKNDLVQNRVLMNFNQGGMSTDQIIKSLRAMIVEGGFTAEAIIIDGLDFSRTSHDRFASIKAFALELGLSVWYSCTVDGGGQQYDERNVPLLLKGFADDLIDVVIVLEPKEDHVALSVSKGNCAQDGKATASNEAPSDEGRAIRLDPRTLLILEG